MKAIHVIAVLSATAALHISCAKATAETSSELAGDSIAAEETVILPIAYPDTMLPSGEAVVYKIDVLDTVHSPELNDLTDPYVGKSDIMAFRADQHRSADFGGRVEGHPNAFQVDWTFNTDYDGSATNLGSWGGGAGWTGQAVTKGDTVMVASLAHKVYFMSFETGKSVKPAVEITNPVKGSPMLDPLGQNYLYIGQAVSITKPWGYLTVDVAKGKVVQQASEDPKAWRHWGGCDSSPLRAGQFILRPHENGGIYKWYVQGDTMLLHSVLRYKVNGRAPGIESSMVIHRNYGYIGDNYGNIICFNINTMKPVWRYDNHDDTDASLVIDVEDDIPYVYTGCEVDKQGSDGFCYFVKLNGLTGEKVWERKIAGRKLMAGEKAVDGGLFSTPLPGRGNCSDMMFVAVVTNIPSYKGDFFAISKASGEIIYSFKLDNRPWMSSVGFLNENDEQYVVAGDTGGRLYLIEGKTGRVITKKVIGSNFEASPIVRDNHMVVGSRGRSYYRISVITETE